MLFSALGLSAVFLLVINFLVWREGRPTIVPLMLCLLATVIGLLFLAHIALAINSFLVGLSLLGCAIADAGPRRFLLASFVATAASYIVISVWLVAPELQTWSALEERYPMESITDRLAYEHGSNDLRQGQWSRDDASTKKRDRLDALETRAERWESNLRTYSLERLHAGTVNQFVNSQGFGIGRIARGLPRPAALKPPEEDSQRFQRGMDTHKEQAPESSDSIIHGSKEWDIQPALIQHEANVFNFANPYDFGYVHDSDHVAGFLPHELLGEPAGFRSWKIEKLELVSLLKFEEPAVYISNELPKMKDLKDAKTRPLDSFESQALTALRHGDDLQVQ